MRFENRRWTSRIPPRSEEHTSELQSPCNLVCRLLLEKKKKHLRMPRNATSGGVEHGHERNVERAAACVLRIHSCCTGVRGLAAPVLSFFFFFNDTATTEIYTLSLHDALPICIVPRQRDVRCFKLIWQVS